MQTRRHHAGESWHPAHKAESRPSVHCCRWPGEPPSPWRLLLGMFRGATGDAPVGRVKRYCQANHIDISREADTGRGPVDFEVSRGYLFPVWQ